MKFLPAALLMLTTHWGMAQTNHFPATGNVGLGTLNPLSALDVKGDILISNADIPMGLSTEVLGTTPLLNMSVNFRHSNVNLGYLGAAFRIDSRASLSVPLFQWLKRDAAQNTDVIMMNLSASGNLGIGIMNATERLAVSGTIRAQEIKVEAANWPDYVFEKDYNLRPLAEVEQFVKLNKHLPDIPSAKEAEANGVALGEMNKLLLKKIEDLTLYIIEQDKRILALEKSKER
ncbi:hypothetical protein SAMN05421820_101724 [Pedobacter steynii]|uniref:Uncharacterized protein n=2 Tax=Pedobacter steynii TaxID=430522 RepID=A0A1G9L0H0_9SPHI|nr:hypothetical protein SAMN05421820_101724 [Pedobacter steynii]